MHINHINKTLLPFTVWHTPKTCVSFNRVWDSPRQSGKAGEGDKHTSQTVARTSTVLWDCTGVHSAVGLYAVGLYITNLGKNSNVLKQEWLWPSLTEDCHCYSNSSYSGGSRKKSGIQLKSCTIKGQLFISGIWFYKSNKGEQALGSSQNLNNGIRQLQGWRDSSWWRRWGRRIQSGTLKPFQWPRVKGLTGT